MVGSDQRAAVRMIVHLFLYRLYTSITADELLAPSVHYLTTTVLLATAVECRLSTDQGTGLFINVPYLKIIELVKCQTAGTMDW